MEGLKDLCCRYKQRVTARKRQLTDCTFVFDSTVLVRKLRTFLTLSWGKVVRQECITLAVRRAAHGRRQSFFHMQKTSFVCIYTEVDTCADVPVVYLDGCRVNRFLLLFRLRTMDFEISFAYHSRSRCMYTIDRYLCRVFRLQSTDRRAG